MKLARIALAIGLVAGALILLVDKDELCVSLFRTLHHVRELMDEVFGAENFVSFITFAKTSFKGWRIRVDTNDNGAAHIARQIELIAAGAAYITNGHAIQRIVEVVGQEYFFDI